MNGDLGEYETAAGEVFSLSMQRARVLDEANHWGFWIVVKHKSWGERAFKSIVARRIAGTVELAEEVLQGDAVDYIHNILDMADKEGMPISPDGLHFDDLGWAVL